MESSILSDLITTLIYNGFHIHKVTRYSKSNAILHVKKFDRLGAKIGYDILVTSDIQPSPLVETVVSQAERDNSTAILISDHFKVADCISYSYEDFFGFFGGIVNTGLVLMPNLDKILNQLGHNSVPNGLIGEANDLHELYVGECLQYLMESPTRRYGIDRSFQSLPDGVVLSKQHFMLLFDAKSYSKGFGIAADDIKRFAAYVEDFKKRYSAFFGEVFTFLIISGSFNDSDDSIENRANELYKLCNCKLSCIKSSDLALIAQRLILVPDAKRSIIWKNIFSNPIIHLKQVEKEITRIKSDNII